MVAFPSDAMTPPLVRTLVSTEKIRDLGLIIESDFVALRCIEGGKPPQVEQVQRQVRASYRFPRMTIQKIKERKPHGLTS